MSQRKTPNSRENLYIIVEGVGDKKLLDTIFNNSYISTKYNIVIVDANGADKIIKKLIEYRRTHNYSTVLVFIDLDDKGKHKINDFFQKLNEKGAKKFLSSKDLYFVNPVIEYLISHWENIHKSQNIY